MTGSPVAAARAAVVPTSMAGRPGLAALLRPRHRRRFRARALLGLMLVEHRARRLRTLLGEIAAVLAAPFEGLDALPVVAGNVRHDVPGVELVGALRRLPIGDVVSLLQVDAKLPVLAV